MGQLDIHESSSTGSVGYMLAATSISVPHKAEVYIKRRSRCKFPKDIAPLHVTQNQNLNMKIELSKTFFYPTFKNDVKMS